MSQRRTFLKQSALLAFSASMPNLFASGVTPPSKRRFRMSLNPGAIGVKTDQWGLLELAHQHGFESIVAFPQQLATFTEEDYARLQEKMAAYKLEWGSAKLPVDFRKDQARFEADLARLPAAAKALQAAGCTRMNTWIMPTHPSLPYRENFAQHVDRISQMAAILLDHNIRFGLEYVGPKTLMARDRYAFIRTMGECKSLIAATGMDNIGLVLDSFHWYCAEDTVEDLRALKPEEIVTCDLNDAHGVRSRDAQIDGQRALPLATGVIDLKAFLEALLTIGYDGPVRAEPFNAALNALDNESALIATKDAMQRAFDLV